MAVDTPLISERKLLAFKVETTTGTAIALTAADATMIAFDVNATPDIEYNNREGNGASLDAHKGTVGPLGMSMSFRTELMGLGSSGLPAWAILLASAGLTLSTQTYISTSPPDGTTLTAASYEDGWKIFGAGMKFNGVMSGVTGKPVMINWTGKGCWQAPIAASILLPTFTNVSPPVLEAATFTIGGVSYRISDFELDLGADVIMREDITTASGYRSAWVTRRKPTFKCSPERVAAGTKNWYTDFTDMATAALNIVIGITANNLITITAPAMQLTNVQGGDRNGIITDNLEFQLNRSANAGDDSLSILFS